MKAGLFFAMFIVKIRLHKVILNFHRRMARDVSREYIMYYNYNNMERNKEFPFNE